MLERTVQMKKTLKEVDPVYNSVTNYMSKSEKIKYCESLIRETEEFLGARERPLDEKSKEKYKTLINAAREEMAMLQKQD